MCPFYEISVFYSWEHNKGFLISTVVFWEDRLALCLSNTYMPTKELHLTSCNHQKVGGQFGVTTLLEGL